MHTRVCILPLGRRVRRRERTPFSLHRERERERESRAIAATCTAGGTSDARACAVAFGSARASRALQLKVGSCPAGTTIGTCLQGESEGERESV